MYFKVRITKGLPQAKTGGFTGNNLNKQVISFGGADMNAASRHLENTRYLKKVPRAEANLEAEGGETAFGDINGDGFTEHMIISGKRHHEGGVPLNLPDGTFIFSDTAAMKITDCNILKMFGKACGKKGYTPAELAKPYDINKYRTILEDPNSDKVDRKTAELMIKNINLKLGALALAQEAKKGFPQGIPEVAIPYMQQMGIREEDLIPQRVQPEAQINNQAMQNPYENQGMGMQSPKEEMIEQRPGMQNPQEEMMEIPPMAQYGIMMGDYSRPAQQLYKNGGSLDKYQSKGEVKYNIPKNAVVVNRGDYKTDEEYQVARNEQFAKAGKNPVYILMPDGKYKKVSQKTKASDPYTGEDLKSTWNNSQEIAATFRDMNMSINSPQFTKLLSDYTKKALKDEESYRLKSGKISKAYEDYSKKDFTPEQIRDAFALHQKRNLALQAHGIKARYFEDASTGRLLTPEQMVKGKILNDQGQPIKLNEAKQIYNKYKANNITDLKKAFDQVGIPLSNTALEQATFQGFTNALKDKDKLTPEEQAALTGWSGYETGVADERGQKNTRISPIDWDYTDTTGEQLSGYTKPAETEFVETDVNGEPIVNQDQTYLPEEEQQPLYKGDPEWWLQDRVNMGLAALDYANIYHPLPFAANYAPEEIPVYLYDQTRAQAANAEQAKIASDAYSALQPASQAAVNISASQGKGALNAANIAAEYDKMNVGQLNATAAQNAQIRNQAQMYNQNLNRELYNETIGAHKKALDQKSARLHNIGQAFNTGTTNMYTTDAMNQMYPNYAVQPGVGGKMYFRDSGRDITPEQQRDYFAYANKLNQAGLPERSQKLLLENYMTGSNSNRGIPDMYGNIAQSKKGGTTQMAYVMGSNVFPFMFY